MNLFDSNVYCDCIFILVFLFIWFKFYTFIICVGGVLCYKSAIHEQQQQQQTEEENEVEE